MLIQSIVIILFCIAQIYGEFFDDLYKYRIFIGFAEVGGLLDRKGSVIHFIDGTVVFLSEKITFSRGRANVEIKASGFIFCAVNSIHGVTILSEYSVFFSYT